MTTPQEGTGTCCVRCYYHLKSSELRHCADYLCPCHSPKEVEESTERLAEAVNKPSVVGRDYASTEGDSWGQEFDRKFDNYAYVAELYAEAQVGDLNLRSLKNWIREKKALWGKENSNYYLDEAEKEITHARALALQEAVAIAKGNLWEYTPDTDYDKVSHYNLGRGNAAREIEALYKDKK